MYGVNTLDRAFYHQVIRNAERLFSIRYTDRNGKRKQWDRVALSADEAMDDFIFYANAHRLNVDFNKSVTIQDCF